MSNQNEQDIARLEREIDGLSVAYHLIITEIVQRTMLQVCLVAINELGDNVQFIGLTTGDQDMSGYQWPTAIAGHVDGVLVDLDEDQDTVDELANYPVSNLDDLTKGAWQPYTVGFGDMGDHTKSTATMKGRLHVHDPSVELWLDVAVIREAFQ